MPEVAVMRLIPRLVVFGLLDLTLLLVLANYTSWEIALAEVVVTGLLGVAVIRYVTAHFGHKVLSRLAASESPAPVLADGAILFVAGLLLILPGIVSDIVGLLLLIPWVRRQTVAWLRRRLLRHTDRFRARFIHGQLADHPRAEGTIIDSHVTDDEPQEEP